MKMDRRAFLAASAAMVAGAGCSERPRVVSAGTRGEPITLAVFDSSGTKTGTIMDNKVIKTDEEWKQQLTPEQYAVTRKKGTERAFTGKYYKNHEKGTYLCVCCANTLFSSDTKFE